MKGWCFGLLLDRLQSADPKHMNILLCFWVMLFVDRLNDLDKSCDGDGGRLLRFQFELNIFAMIKNDKKYFEN